MAWPVAIFGPGYEQSKATNVGAFWLAVSERNQALGGSAIACPVAGELVTGAMNSAGSIYVEEGNPARNFGIQFLQNFVAGSASSFMLPGTSIVARFTTNRAGVVNDTRFWGTDPAGGSDNLFLAIGASAYGFTRKREATTFVTSPASNYTDAGGFFLDPANNPIPVAEGDLAISEGDGNKYRWTSGAWTLATNQLAQGRLLVGAGLIRPGDYLGEWLWQEIHDTLNLMHTTAGSFVFSADDAGRGGGRFGYGRSDEVISPDGTSQTPASVRDALDAAQADWDAHAEEVDTSDWSGRTNMPGAYYPFVNGPIAGLSLIEVSYSEWQPPDSPVDDYGTPVALIQAQIMRWRGVPYGAAPNFCARSVSLYGQFFGPNNAGGYPSTVGSIEENGDHGAIGSVGDPEFNAAAHFTLIASAGPTTDALSTAFPVMSVNTAYPTWPAHAYPGTAATDTSFTFWEGYQLGGGLTKIEWKVSGGFRFV